MATKRVDNIQFSVPIADIEFIELDLTMEWYEVHLLTDKPQEPSYQIAATKSMMFEGTNIVFA